VEIAPKNLIFYFINIFIFFCKVAQVAWSKINATNKQSDEKIPIDLNGFDAGKNGST
jgi:hypothetical protein